MWTTSYLSPQTQTKDFDLFPPFAKRSKEVNRYSEETALPVQLQHDETFWKTNMPQPCDESFGYEPFRATAFSSPAGMMTGHNGVNVSLTHEKLPHPSKLMGRKKRVRGPQTHAANVVKHIGELRMKQRHINWLKGDKWWGTTTLSHLEDSSGQQKLSFPGNEQLLDFPADVSLNEMLMKNPEETEKMPYQAASSQTRQFLCTGYEQFLDLAPGGNPMMSFVAGTAQRWPLMADDATLNCGESDRILRSEDDEMLLLQNLEFL